MGRSKMKFLLSASLVLFCSSAITTGSDCTESESFVIKNAMQSTGAYLTLDVKKNTLRGGNLQRNGQPKDNQIWRWLNCEDGSFLTIGGKFLVYDPSNKKKPLRVVGSTSGLSGTRRNQPQVAKLLPRGMSSGVSPPSRARRTSRLCS